MAFDGTTELSSLNVRTQLRSPSLWYEPSADAYPERRLWLSVVIQAIADYEGACYRIESTWVKTQRPVARELHLELESVRRQICHEFFNTVCDLAGIEHVVVLGKVKQFDWDYSIAAIPCDPHGEVLSVWQHRQVRIGRRVRK